MPRCSQPTLVTATIVRGVPEPGDVIAGDPKMAYARLMKRGLSERFWLEYVFEAYANHQPDAVFLNGLPDIAESRPHSKVNSDREIELIG